MLELIKSVSKPIRYIGNEYNQRIKDLDKIRLRICLCFPEIYEIGMSHLGWKILYHIINKREDVYAERVFIPWGDMEKMLSSHSIPLYSLETKSPLYSFDVIGISLLYELTYSNIITLLKLSGIPIRSEERKDYHPLIIGGGPCAFNPEPLSDIIDLFAIGDGEDIIEEIIEAMLDLKKASANRKDKLKKLSEIKGIYIPKFFSKKLDLQNGLIYREATNNASKVIEKRIISFDKSYEYMENLVVPNTEVIHDRISLEIMRGCERGCRFCHAGFVYRPNREMNPKNIIDILGKAILSTGYDEVSLASLSTGDYSQLHKILPSIADFIQSNQISISFPSLFPSSLTEELLLEILKVRKTGITIAPEAATDSLRAIINKPISNEEILAAAELAFKNGWQMIKLYFMIGLPFEKEEDIREIANLCIKISELGKKIDSKSGQLNVTISSFVPKAHTPFQWAPMNTIGELLDKQILLKKLLERYKRITLKFQDPRISWLEGIFSRGDSRLNEIIISAWLAGARFDGWDEKFNFQAWQQAFEKLNLDPSIYLKSLPIDSILPWDHISIGVDKDYLISEWNKSKKGEITPSTDIHKCNQCGVCSPALLKQLISNAKKFELPQIFAKPSQQSDIHNKKIKCRISFKKKDTAIFLSHLDLYRMIRLILKRANLPISYSEGFHPMPRISLAPALPTGIASEESFFDIILYEYENPNNILAKLNNVSIPGVIFSKIALIPLNSPSINSYITHSLFSFKLDDPVFQEYFFTSSKDLLLLMHKRKWEWFSEKKDFFILKKDKRINLINHIEAISFKEKEFILIILLKMLPDCSVNITTLLDAIYPEIPIPFSLTHESFLIEKKGKKLGIFDYENEIINLCKKIYN